MNSESSTTSLKRRTLLSATAVGMSGCVSGIYRESQSGASRQLGSTSWKMVGENSKNTSGFDSNIGTAFEKTSWRKPIGSPFFGPVITTSEHAIVNSQPKAFGFKKSSGKLVLSKSLPGGVAGAPAVTDDHVLVPRDTYGEGYGPGDEIESPRLYAIGRDSKEIEWKLELSGSYLASVAVAEDIYIQSDREVIRLKPDGTTVWNQNLDESFDWRDTLSYIRPAIGQTGVYVGHRGSLIKLGRDSGAVIWSRSMGKTLFPPVLTGDSTIITSTRSETVGVDRSDGRVRWRIKDTPAWVPASNEKIAVITKSGELVGIDQARGEQRWSKQMSLSTCPPVIAGDIAYVVPGGTDLVAIDVGTGKQRDRLSTDKIVDWVTPDAGGLFTRMWSTDGPTLVRHQLK